MITTRRITDNPLDFFKDDLLLALRRIQIDLDTCDEGLADPATLETMVDAIDQIRNPLAALECRDAVALLDEMRATVLEGAHNITLLRQAAQQLSACLETHLSPGNRQTNSELLVETATALRQARQRGIAAPVTAPIETSTVYDVRDLLGRLQQTITEQVEKAADEAASWEALQENLRILCPMVAERGWNRATQILERLNRIVDVLVTGGAEHYGWLVSSVCAEILASLSYSLESLSNGIPAAATVLNNAEAQLAQLDTLLGLSARLEVASKPSPCATPIMETPNDLDLPDLPEFGAPAAAPSQSLPTPVQSDSKTDREWLDFTSAPLDLSVEETPIAVGETLESAKPGTNMEDLIHLIGLSDTDPEFIEVFLEEARGELEVMREQIALWRSDLTDRQALTTLRRAFHTLKGSGRMVNAMVIGDFAWEFESLLNQVLEGSLPASLEIVDTLVAAVGVLSPLVSETPLQGGELERLAALAARARALPQSQPLTAPESTPVAAPAPREPVIGVEPETRTTRSVRVIAPDMDPEFIDVFLEEARGELAMIREQMAVWRANFEDRSALAILRRAFHTLKGSGRVVGAVVIGDFAWCFENLLNQVLNGTVAAAPAMADLFDEATTVLEALLGEEAMAEAALARLPGLTARADALLQELPVIMPLSVEALEAEAMAEPSIEAPTSAAQPAEGITSVSGAMQPTEEVTPVVGAIPEPAMAPSIDIEPAQVFQYEAAEILDASDAILQRLGAEPDNVGLLNDLRRGMHTLKGSSRMAGIMTVGDLAHAAESVLDALGKGYQATPMVLDALQHTLDRLNRMLTDAASGESPVAATDLIHDLHQLADTVTTGEQAETGLISIAKPTAVITELASFRAMTELDQELVQVFQSEAGEILDSSDTILQRLRGQPDNIELLNDLRREMHTLKGSSRMAGFMTVGDVAHAAESVLDALSKGVLKMSDSVLDQIQSAMDGLHQMLTGILSGAQPVARPELIDALQGAPGDKPAERRLRPAAPVPVAPTIAPMAVPAARRPVELPVAAPTDAIRVSAALLNTLVNQMGESSIFRARIDQGVSAMSHNLSDLEQTITRLRRQVTHLATQAEARIQSRQDQGPKAHQQEFDPLELDRFTELQQVSRSLMEIADDLGNVGNSLSEHAREITTLLDQQGKVNKEIQQGLMRTGMVRFGSVVPRLRRVVRQATQDLGKRAELLVGGEEAEVDRTVLESMLAPLEHMLRNSLAHGIEMPEQRRAANKPEIGTITLSLRREGAELVLELSDDGAGINFAAIRTKGEEKGLLLPGQPATSEELIALLLRPGFSTATAVTQVSGRGVGMDVVNEAIRAMRGALLIQTDVGQGTRFIIRLPFSLAVTQALLVQAGEGLFAIPLLSIEVVTRLKESEFQAYLAGEQVQHEYSDRHYPVHNLGILVSSERVLPFEEVKDRRPPMLLFRSAEASAALQVESVIGNQEIIVKPISPQFNGVLGISGATVLGDGRVVVVLELAALVRNIGSQRQKQMESRALRAARQETRQEKLTIMVIDDSITMRRVTSRILERHNIQAITAKDGLDAVAMLQTQVPDLAILDIEMPRMDGFEVVAHVRNQTNLRHLPIIMVTSRGGEKHRERAMNLGVNDYLTKPYQEDQLMESIRNILGERALDLMT